MAHLSSRQTSWLPWGLVAAYAAWVVFCFPWLGLYEIDPDEGLNLAKAALVSAGYGLYRDIWSDQPPLLTYALALLQQLFPWSVTAARGLVLASACLLLVSMHGLVYRWHGRLAAMVTVLLLMTAPLFVQLSAAVMVGLPAIALAVLAMDVTSRRGRAGHAGAALAGLVFALSLQTKLFTFLMGPAVVAVLWLSRTPDGRRCQVRALGAFVLGSVAGLAVVVWVAGEPFIDQLIRPHLAEELRQAYSLQESGDLIWRVLQQQPVLLVAGLVGLIWHGWRSRRDSLPLLLWLAVPATALLVHTPVWSHQVLLLLLPMAWMGGSVLGAAGDWMWSRGIPAWRALAVAVSSGLAGLAAWLALAAPPPDPGLYKVSMGDAVQRFAPLGGWVVTDSPLDAFRAGLLVPPELAVYSWKRIQVGRLSAQDVLDVIERRQPMQVSFRRFPVDPVIAGYLDTHFVRTAQEGRVVHYLARKAQFPLVDADIQAVLRRFLDDFGATGLDGAYAGIVDQQQPPQRFGESVSERLGEASAFMRPPGSTPRVGACFVRSYRLTGDEHYLAMAGEVAQALVRTQHCSGAWASDARPGSTCQQQASPPSNLTLDEGLIAEAVDYLQDMARLSPADNAAWNAAAVRALDFLVRTQNAQGAWPYDLSGENNYKRYSTINDDLTTSHIRVLLRGYLKYGQKTYRDAVQRGVEFLLQGQSRRGGWAQQYDERGGGAPGRSFEPAALATIESAYAIRTLIEVDQHMPDPRIRAAIGRGAGWLNRTALRPSYWARFHDHSNGGALYLDRTGQVYPRWQDLPEERRYGYRWEGNFPEVAAVIALADAHLSGEPARFDATLQRLSELAHADDYVKALKVLGPSMTQGRLPLQGARELIWAKDFIENCKLLQAMWRVTAEVTVVPDIEKLLRD